MPFWVIVSLISILMVFTWRARVRRWLRRPTNEAEQVERCRRGYSLAGLTMPRCPECGRVVGFDATAEELTLTNEELERAHAVREQRRSSQIRNTKFE